MDGSASRTQAVAAISVTHGISGACHGTGDQPLGTFRAERVTQLSAHDSQARLGEERKASGASYGAGDHPLETFLMERMARLEGPIDHVTRLEEELRTPGAGGRPPETCLMEFMDILMTVFCIITYVYGAIPMHTEQLMDPVDSPARTMTPRNPTPHADGRTAPLTHESNPRNPICPGSSEVAVEIGDYLGLVITVDILKLQWRLVVTLEDDYLGHSEVTVKIGDYLGLVITLNILRLQRTLVIALDE